MGGPNPVSGCSGLDGGYTQWIIGSRPCSMRGMAAQIHDIVTSASGVVLNPFLLIVPIVVVLAIITGFAGRVAVIVEDLRYSRIHSRNG